MQFNPPLKQASILRRYKRFLADIELPDGSQCTIHCPNTGAMTGCVVAESPCWYSVSANPKRKYPYTWEIATTETGHLAGIHSAKANQLVYEAIEEGVIDELTGYDSCATEVRYGEENSRIDLCLSTGDSRCYVEVKSVTLANAQGVGYFPDAVSERASRHLRELVGVRDSGHRAVLVFCVQHTGINSVSPADHIDATYGETLRWAAANGVELLAYRADISPEEIRLSTPIPVEL